MQLRDGTKVSFTIRKMFRGGIAHQLDKAFTKCCSDQIHGHSYRVEFFFSAEELDDTGMVLDFGKINAILKNYLDGQWDHALIMPSTMPKEYLSMLEKFNKKLRIVDYNPTAEGMALEIFKIASILIAMDLDRSDVRLDKVRVPETETGYAEWIWIVRMSAWTRFGYLKLKRVMRRY